MVAIKRHILVCALVLGLSGFAGCAGMPEIEKPQFTQRHYTYSVLLFPEKPGKSPQLKMAMSLLCMEYPAVQAEALHGILYAQASLGEYKDSVLKEQRNNYRSRVGDLPADEDTANYNWRYAERFDVKQIFERGIVIERVLETYSGGAHSGTITRYYNIEIDGDEFRQLTLDDFFANFQENQQVRDIVYAELRAHSGLNSAQPLSQGIYFINEPELTFNFFVTEEGLGLHWDPAQIASHSEGSIQIIVPWYEIQPLMLYMGYEALAKFNIDLFSNNEEW